MVVVVREEERRGKWPPSCCPFLHLPWLALAPKVGMENMKVLGLVPTGLWLKFCHLCELILSWAWGTRQLRGQKSFPWKSRGSSPSQHGADGPWPPLTITTFPPAPCLSQSVPSLRNHTCAGPPRAPLKDQLGWCDMYGGCPWESCPSISSTSSLWLSFLPQEALCSLAVTHFWPLDSGKPGFSKGGPVPGIGSEEHTDAMIVAPQDLGPHHGAGKQSWPPGIREGAHLFQGK